MKTKFNRKHSRSKPRSEATPSQGITPADIIRDKLRLYVDKFARITKNGVEYSLYDHKTKTSTKKICTHAECERIVRELYS